MTARYMSTTYRAPSGPTERFTGRNQVSGEARNSTPSRFGWERNVAPRGSRTSMWTRLPVGSQVKAAPW